MNHNLLAFNIGDATPLSSGRNLSSYTSFSDIINLILGNAVVFAGIILVALLIFGGLTFIINAGGGDPKKADQGKKTITASLIGFVIVVFAYLIIKLIEWATGLDILNPTFE